MPFATINDAVEDSKRGMVIIADDEDRDNEGDMLAGGKVTPEIINLWSPTEAVECFAQ